MPVIGGGRGVEVTRVGGGYQGNRVRAQQGVRDSRRGREVEKGEEEPRAGGRGKRPTRRSETGRPEGVGGRVAMEGEEGAKQAREKVQRWRWRKIARDTANEAEQ